MASPDLQPHFIFQAGRKFLPSGSWLYYSFSAVWAPAQVWYRFREVETHTDSHTLTHAPVPHTLQTHTTHTYIHIAHITHTLRPTLTCIHTHSHIYITHTHSHTFCSHTHTQSYTTHTTHATYYCVRQKVHSSFSKGSCRKPQANFLAHPVYPHTHHTCTTAFLWTNTEIWEIIQKTA